VGAVNTAKVNEIQSYLSPRKTQKTQKRYDSESVIKDFRGLSRISRATTKPERRWVSFLNPTYNSCVVFLPETIRPRSFPRRNQKKLAFFFIFVLSSFLKKKHFPIISPFKSRKSLMRK